MHRGHSLDKTNYINPVRIRNASTGRHRRKVALGLGAWFFALAPFVPSACSLDEGGFGIIPLPDNRPDTSPNVDARANDAQSDTGTRDGHLDPDTQPPPQDARADGGAYERCLQACGPARGTCTSDGVCVVSCSSTKKCNQSNHGCPSDGSVPCRVKCDGTDACDGISCTNCEIRCEEQGACKNAFSCRGDRCAILCCGASTCIGNLSCTGTDCTVYCESGACSNVPQCNNGRASCNVGRNCDD